MTELSRCQHQGLCDNRDPKCVSYIPEQRQELCPEKCAHGGQCIYFHGHATDETKLEHLTRTCPEFGTSQFRADPRETYFRVERKLGNGQWRTEYVGADKGEARFALWNLVEKAEQVGLQVRVRTEEWTK